MATTSTCLHDSEWTCCWWTYCRGGNARHSWSFGPGSVENLTATHNGSLSYPELIRRDTANKQHLSNDRRTKYGEWARTMIIIVRALSLSLSFMIIYNWIATSTPHNQHQPAWHDGYTQSRNWVISRDSYMPRGAIIGSLVTHKASSFFLAVCMSPCTMACTTRSEKIR